MELTELTAAEYASAFSHTATPYATVDFNLLNASKADGLVFAALRDSSGKARLGAIFGQRGDKLFCPFSAPFGEFAYASSRQKLETVAEFVTLLQGRYGKGNIALTLPPPFYDTVMHPRVAGSLGVIGQASHVDFNYHYRLSASDDFASRLDANARNHLNRALRAGFVFGVCDLDEAYAVIESNRREKGYPLRMTKSQLEDTSAIITVDAFSLTLDAQAVAAAIVYRLNSKVAQVIYWGHLGDWSSSHPMNLLARELFAHYYLAGFEIVDIGPSSSDGVPDMGLCAFKESIGCDLTFKPSFII